MLEPELITDAAALEALAPRLARAERIAVDVEANGLFAYRARLCTLQLAMETDGELTIVLVDTLAIDIAPLRAALGESGPLKVLHDLTFDAELLASVGTPLGRVRDTSVAARFLGHEATGLANVLDRELGITIDKSLQQHDWGKRPLTEAALAYLASDVAHLLALDARLAERALEADILEEIEEESRHRARQAGARLLDMQPAYTRIKHASTLPTWGERAILRRVHAVREDLASARDVPSHRIMPSDMLLQLCRAKATTVEAFRAIVERRRPDLDPSAFLAAVAQGLHDGDVPEEDKVYFERPTVNPLLVERRRRRDGQVHAWRKAESARRGVSEQAILPGHCAHGVAQALAEIHPDDESKRDALTRVPGLGDKRLRSYVEAWLAFEDLV
jgi:ribonuclease D